MIVVTCGCKILYLILNMVDFNESRDNMSKELTVVISFLNEGEEVKNTVESVLKYAQDQVEIIVINDGSSRLYDYKEMMRPYQCVTYVDNGKRLGTPACRDMGVDMSKTPYFILLDAHMRFYESGWVDKIVNLLREDDRRLLCCQTKALEKDESDEIVEMSAEESCGARICFDNVDEILEPKWILDNIPDGDVVDIPCVLGATYAGSKRYWNRIKGYEGLRLYGYEEPYISIKTWLEGGRCQLIKNIEVGHIYRKRFPYRVGFGEMMYNRMVIAYLLLPDEVRDKVYARCRKESDFIFNEILEEIKCCETELGLLRKYYNEIFSNEFGLIEKMNIVVG